MVAARTSGGTISRVGSASRGGGAGIESRGSWGGGGKSFGNTATFESKFSGRSFAAYKSPARSEVRSVPAFFISKSGQLERHAPVSAPKKVETPKTTSSQTPRQVFGPRLEVVKSPSADTHRPGTTLLRETQPLYTRQSEKPRTPQVKSARQIFGPRLEAVRAQSRDTYRPNVSALKETKPIYVSQADAKYHAQPGHAKFHTEPKAVQPRKVEQSAVKRNIRSFGPKLDVLKASTPDTHRPHTSLVKNTSTLYSRAEVKPKIEQSRAPKVSTKAFGPKLEVVRKSSVDSHLPGESVTRNMAKVYSTPETRPTAVQTTQPKEVTPKAQPREQHPLYKTTEELALRDVRTRLQREVKQGLPDRSLYERTQMKLDPAKNRVIISAGGERKVVPGKVDGSGRWNQVLAKKAATAQTIRTGEIKQASHIPAKLQKEAGISNDEYKTLQKKVEAATPLKSKLLSTTEPLQVQTTTQLDRVVREQLNHPTQTIIKPGVQVEQPTKRDHGLVQPAVRVLTHAETQQVLDRFVQHTQEKAGLPETQTRPQIRLADIRSQEARADIEQAARVLQAYREVIKTQPYSTVTNQEAERAVVNALDQKLDAYGLKTEIIQTTPLQVREPSLQSQRRYVGGIQTEPLSSPIPVSRLSMIPGTIDTLTASQDLTGVTATALPDLEIATVNQTIINAELDTAQLLQIQQRQMVKTQIQVQSAREEEEEEEVDEEEKTEKEKKNEEQMLEELQFKLLYERDLDKDQMRRQIAIEVARMLFDTNHGQPISGESLAGTMNDVYVMLESDIVRDGMPDDYLTEIIDELSAGEYSNLEEVRSKLMALTHRKPAITIGRVPNVSLQDVEIVRNSKKYPRLY